MRNRGLEAAALLIILSAATNILILVESAPPATITFNSPHAALAPTNATGVYYLAQPFTFTSLNRTATMDTYTTLTCVADGHTWGTLGYSCTTAGQDTHILNLTQNKLTFNASGACTVLVYTPTAGEATHIAGPATSVWNGLTKINTVTITGAGTVILTFAETFIINVYSIYEEIEEDFSTLLYATCVDSLGVSHGSNVTFTINAASFVWNSKTNHYESVVMKTTPQTQVYGVLGLFTDSENALSTGSVALNATVTWTTSRLTTVLPYVRTGDLPGAVFAIDAYTIGSTFLYTFIAIALSGAMYNHSGAEAALVVWLVLWGAWSSVVSGTAVTVGVLFLALGGGLLLAKVYLDRRNT